MPIQFQQYIFSDLDIGKQLGLNLLVPDARSRQSLQINAIPTYNTGSNPAFAMNCTFVPNTNAYCGIATSISLTHTPMSLNYTLVVTRTGTSNISSFVIDQNVYMKNITLVRESTFAVDYQLSSSVMIVLYPSTLINPSFAYTCQVNRSMSSQMNAATYNSGTNTWQCNVTSSDKEELLTITPYVMINGTNYVISNNAATFQFARFQFVPSIIEANNDTRITVIMKDTRLPLTVPEKYRTSNFTVLLVATGYQREIQCAVNSTGGLNCQTGLFTALPYDIMAFHTISIKLNGSEVFTVSHPIAVYKQNSVALIAPLAGLHNVDTSVNIQFSASTVSVQPGLQAFFFCAVQGYPNLYFTANNTNGNRVRCDVVMNKLRADELNITLVPMLWLPSIDNSTNVTLSVVQNEMFYLMRRGITSLTNAKQSLLLRTGSELNLQFTIATYIAPLLKTKIMCYVGVSNAFNAIHLNSSADNMNHNFSCVVTDTSNGGAKPTYLVYDDGTPGASFNLSSNSIEFAFYSPIQIANLEPNVGRTNRSLPVTIKSGFYNDLFYGSDQYYYLAGVSPQLNTTLRFNATILGQGNFQVNMTHNMTEIIPFYLWLYAKGFAAQIVDDALRFRFLDSFYLIPVRYYLFFSFYI